MKLLILFLQVAVWLELLADGESFLLVRTESNQFLKNRSPHLTRSESDKETKSSQGSPSASDSVKNAFKILFSSPDWRVMILAIAPAEAMENPAFRGKWRISSDDRFVTSKNTKGLVVISSTKEELLNPTFREIWRLGELSEEVKNSVEGENFFESPQWKELLRVTGLNVDDDADDWEKAKVLASWFAPALKQVQKKLDSARDWK